MSVSLPWPGAVAVAALALVGASAAAQSSQSAQSGPRCSGESPSLRLPNCFPSITMVLTRSSRSTPPTIITSSPRSSASTSSGPTVTISTSSGRSHPYCMSSARTSACRHMPGTPYSSPYAMSTLAARAGYSAYSSGGYGLGQVGSGEMGYGYALQGMASLTSANGQAWKDIETAALSREGLRQAALDTARRRIEFEAWVQTAAPTAPRMRDREMTTDLALTRQAVTSTDILSGKALNLLLNSIQKSGRLQNGPPVPIEEATLKSINVTGGGSPAGVGMLKDGGRVNWPEGLRDAPFDQPRKRLADNLMLAVEGLKEGEMVPNSRLKDIRSDLKDLTDRLVAGANDVPPAQYIEARRFLRELETACKALADSKAASYFNNTWQARGRNAAELAAHLTREGLLFAPAAPGDELAYRAVYDALRTFEAGLQVAQR